MPSLRERLSSLCRVLPSLPASVAVLSQRYHRGSHNDGTRGVSEPNLSQQCCRRVRVNVVVSDRRMRIERKGMAGGRGARIGGEPPPVVTVTAATKTVFDGLPLQSPLPSEPPSSSNPSITTPTTTAHGHRDHEARDNCTRQSLRPSDPISTTWSIPLYSGTSKSYFLAIPGATNLAPDASQLWTAHENEGAMERGVGLGEVKRGSLRTVLQRNGVPGSV